jgi:hypothetical protein
MEHVTKEQYEARKKTDIPETYQYGLLFVQLAILCISLLQ